MAVLFSFLELLMNFIIISARRRISYAVNMSVPIPYFVVYFLRLGLYSIYAKVTVDVLTSKVVSGCRRTRNGFISYAMLCYAVLYLYLICQNSA